MDEQPLREVYLQPGESQLVSEPAVIRTILGSCVGITFRHARLGLAGMCHPMLPTYPKPSSSPRAGPRASHEEGTRFVDFAIQDMALKLDARGALRTEVEVKLFGGANVLAVNPSSTQPTVGGMNCEAAIRTLDEEGFHISASSLGGNCGIRIQFNTQTGEVLLRRLG